MISLKEWCKRPVGSLTSCSVEEKSNYFHIKINDNDYVCFQPSRIDSINNYPYPAKKNEESLGNIIDQPKLSQECIERLEEKFKITVQNSFTRVSKFTLNMSLLPTLVSNNLKGGL